MKDRTLDQQCTVTRPGISALASSCVVELLVNVLNSKCGYDYCNYSTVGFFNVLQFRPWSAASIKSDPSERTESEMGLVPHQIRGFQTHFSNLLISGQAYDKCTACSKLILDEYKENGLNFVLNALNNTNYLEDLTGLSEMHKQTDEVYVDWDEDVDEISE